MSNQASVISSVPVAAASAPTHGDRRQAANAVSRNASARPESNPDHARSQWRVSWWAFNEDESQIVHGNSETPITPKRAITQ